MSDDAQTKTAGEKTCEEILAVWCDKLEESFGLESGFLFAWALAKKMNERWENSETVTKMPDGEQGKVALQLLANFAVARLTHELGPRSSGMTHDEKTEKTEKPQRRYGKRWGRISISSQLIEQAVYELSQGNRDSFGALMGFMAEVLIVRAGDAVDGTTINYLGVSPHFDELEEGEVIPEYMIEFERKRICNACQGAEWGPNDSMVELEATFIACKGCGGPTENSRWVGEFKACRRQI